MIIFSKQSGEVSEGNSTWEVGVSVAENPTPNISDGYICMLTIKSCRSIREKLQEKQCVWGFKETSQICRASDPNVGFYHRCRSART